MLAWISFLNVFNSLFANEMLRLAFLAASALRVSGIAIARHGNTHGPFVKHFHCLAICYRLSAVNTRLVVKNFSHANLLLCLPRYTIPAPHVKA